MLIIFLLLQFASNNFFAEEVLRLPALFSHYRHHAAEHRDTHDFFDFLYKHYGNSDHKDDDEHRGLPFKHCGDRCMNIHNTSVWFLPSLPDTDFHLYQLNRTSFYTHEERIPNLVLGSIWQPPKSA